MPGGPAEQRDNGKGLVVWASEGRFPDYSSWPNLGADGQSHYWGPEDVGGRPSSTFPFSLLRTSVFLSVKWGGHHR